MIVISDTSPLSGLIIVGLPHLLSQIFGTVIVPEAVYRELMANGDDHLITQTIQTAEWITVQSVQDLLKVDRLKKDFLIDSGEAEAIVLVEELEADRLLIDERLGRDVAEQRGIQITGVLGILLLAKEQSLIREVKPCMDKLIEQANFRIRPSLYQKVLVLAKETTESAT